MWMSWGVSQVLLAGLAAARPCYWTEVPGGLPDHCTELDLIAQDVGPAEAAQLAGALPSSRVTMVDLRGNRIGPVGAEALAAALGSDSRLVELDLKGNQVGPDGVAALARALEGNSRLKDLNLKQNQLGDEGARVMAGLLAKGSGLTSLNLRDNEIGDDGAVAVADALTKLKDDESSRLTRLFLQHGNRIGPAGSEAIALALRDNPRVVADFAPAPPLEPEGEL